MRSVNHRRLSMELAAALTVLELVSLMGLVYGVLVLLELQPVIPLPPWQTLVYVAWFAVGAVCVYAMLLGKTRAAYVLGIATFVVTILEFMSGAATWGGASLGLCVAILLVLYVRSNPSETDVLNAVGDSHDRRERHL